jgi:hypothetical protein
LTPSYIKNEIRNRPKKSQNFRANEKMNGEKKNSRAASRTIAFSRITSSLHGTGWTRRTIKITAATLHVVAGGSWSEDTFETCGS